MTSSVLLDEAVSCSGAVVAFCSAVELCTNTVNIKFCGENPVPVPLFPQQIHCKLAWDRNLANTVWLKT